ncbi:hypothetical protein Bca52824_081177 [Brassica carinata]|uniref:Uncharacterized protein n=1 Tax=Brassica carinata TaxID=52824 RepID=A0A8X7TRN5_BRACI|nr:hypothetical protein Bca52824_081177 [Brassica carinata]
MELGGLSLLPDLERYYESSVPDSIAAAIWFTGTTKKSHAYITVIDGLIILDYEDLGRASGNAVILAQKTDRTRSSYRLVRPGSIHESLVQLSLGDRVEKYHAWYSSMQRGRDDVTYYDHVQKSCLSARQYGTYHSRRSFMRSASLMMLRSAVRSARGKLGLGWDRIATVIFCYVPPLLRQKEKVPHELSFCGVVAGPIRDWLRDRGSMGPLTSSYVLCGSREANEGKLFELTGEQYKPFSGPGKSSELSRAGEATAYTTAPLPRLASGKASTLLARNSSIQTNESFFWYLCAPRPETDPQHSAHSLCAREGVPPASLKKLGSSVKFMRPRRSGAAATLFFLSWISLVPPKRSWPYHSVPDGQRGIRYSSSRSFAPFRRTGHMLAVGSMVPKVTSVRQFRLNSSLYVSGPMARAGAPRSFFLCGTMPGREGNASRRRTTTRQLHFGFSLHEMSPVHWTDG